MFRGRVDLGPTHILGPPTVGGVLTLRDPDVVDRQSVRERLLVPTLVLVAMVTALVSSLGAPLVPSIARSEGVSLSAAQWSLTVTLLAGAVATPVVGRLGGFRHRRRVLLTGLGVVASGTALAALPLGFTELLVGRALQGVGLALAPLTIVIARDSVARDRVRSAIAVLSLAVVTGAGLSYPVTAAVAQYGGLAAAYWVGFVVTLLTLTLTAWVVPPARSSRDVPVDWVGAALLAVGSSGLLLAVSRGQAWGWTSPRTLALSLLAVLLLVGYAIHSLRTAHPLVDLRLATRRGVIGANTAAVLAGAGMYFALALVMVFAQAPAVGGHGLGLSVTAAGTMLVPYSLCSVLGNSAVRRLERFLPPDFLLPVGCGIYLVATLLLAWRHGTAWDLVVAMAVAGFGSGCTFAAMPGLMVRFVPLAETGSAMAFNQVLRYLGFSAGSALSVVALEAGAPAGQPAAAGFTFATLVGAALWSVAIGTTLVLAVRAR